jgi:hypothetical protein
VAGELPAGGRAGDTIAVPLCRGLCTGWNRLEFQCGVRLLDPVLDVDGTHHADPRLTRVMQARRGTPCEAHPPIWDTSGIGPSSPWQYQVPALYFHVDA